ncbi:HAMP domain-containing sensor histidine kinase [Sideroxydans sp. CL21]|uniref:HAMP domain-containing sensor histidine kinase n=1 Tax=Sideroxydans sp. CL21 TaxID=2600596 RepID=UPI0024BCC709|nr:HAMP domain-containing sensor histidine kinase [Sideroxydans sp. CL21]
MSLKPDSDANSLAASPSRLYSHQQSCFYISLPKIWRVFSAVIQATTRCTMSNNFVATLKKKLSGLPPKSFAGLILVGLLLVALPLILPLIYSTASISQLSKQSRQAVYQAEQIAHFSRILVDQAAAMERSVRLSLILADKSLLKGYYQGHGKFREILQNLSTLPLTDKQHQLVSIMDTSESAIYSRVQKIHLPRKKAGIRNIDFTPLMDSTQEFLIHGDAPVEHEVEAMQEMAGQANKITYWLLIGLVPLALLLAFGFSILITRPIRQIDDAIRAMGNGELSNTIKIDGPQDLQQLGDRLNWMRLRLLEIEEQKSTFLQHISHELKTPLTSIREGANLLSEGIAGKLTAKQNEIARILFANSIQLQKRIEDLLNYSALQAGKAALHIQRVALRMVLESVLHDQYLAITNKSLQIELLCPDLMLECDEQKVRTIVDNLLSNAIKYSPQGGLVKIHAGVIDSSVRLEVQDSGPGIDPMDREKIFDAFYQGRKAPQGHIRGTGLGLSIAREYVLAHGGSIELLEIHQGTCFRITLPLNRATATL